MSSVDVEEGRVESADPSAQVEAVRLDQDELANDFTGMGSASSPEVHAPTAKPKTRRNRNDFDDDTLTASQTCATSDWFPGRRNPIGPRRRLRSAEVACDLVRVIARISADIAWVEVSDGGGNIGLVTRQRLSVHGARIRIDGGNGSPRRVA